MRKKKIVLTGGPGGGKTTALDLFRREFKDEVVIVPEAATLLFKNGIVKPSNLEETKRTQLSIYYMQKNLEKIYERQFPEKTLICDRGCLDSLAYWPGHQDEFLSLVQSDMNTEYQRYDAVIFFETAASSGQDIHSNNPYRSESDEQAIELDKKLQEIWRKHPNYHHVGSSISFIEKIVAGVNTIKQVTCD